LKNRTNDDDASDDDADDDATGVDDEGESL
jgi:hypothetical protein